MIIYSTLGKLENLQLNKAPKGKDRFPSIFFQGQAVSLRECKIECRVPFSQLVFLLTASKIEIQGLDSRHKQALFRSPRHKP